MTEEFDMQELINEVTSALEVAIEDAIEYAIQDAVEDSVNCAVQDALEGALGEALSDLEFTLRDGTVVTPKKKMKLLSPNKSKLLLCYGGLRADGKCLCVQTRSCSWENIAEYPTHEEAVADLLRVKKAMDDGMDSFEL